MIPDPQPPMILDAMTLRGIGSYLHSARLDIKPLTILCGANGSGKSTWLKALNLLEDSLKANRFPFGLAIADWSPQNIQVTNAFYHLAEPEKFQILESPNATRDFGSPATIGLEFHATQDFQLQWKDPIDPQRESAWQFLHRGAVRANDRFRLRFAHPTYWEDATSTPSLLHVVELQLNGQHTIRLEGERDPFEKYEEGFTRPRRSKPYSLSCSKSFLTGSDDDDDELIDVALFRDLITPKYEPLSGFVEEAEIPQMLDSLVSRLCELLQKVLDGYFYVGAIRLPYTSLKLDDATAATTNKTRYVGPAGEKAWSLERAYGEDLMRRIVQPKFDADETRTVAECLRTGLHCRARNLVIERSSLASKILHLWDRLSPSIRQQLEDLLMSEEIQVSLPSLPQLLDALNELLDDRTFFVHEIFAIENKYFDEDGIWIEDEYLEDQDVARLVEKGIDQLSAEDVRILNYLLILEAFELTNRQRCNFRTYLSCWLKQLVQVGLNRTQKWRDGWGQSLSSGTDKLGQPTPFLTNFGFHSSGNSDSGVARLDHPTFGGDMLGALQPPRQMSAGFHQVFPLIVQLGLMQSGELFGIENPEVHLHPALQIRLTEALLAHAVSGRRLIVETHSDLVVRRVIRAFLEEDIAQSQVQIYFVGLEANDSLPLESEFQSSKLEPIQTDNRGRIANWPEGFLDADVRESQRLMDIMYGNANEEEDDDGHTSQ